MCLLPGPLSRISCCCNEQYRNKEQEEREKSRLAAELAEDTKRSSHRHRSQSRRRSSKSPRHHQDRTRHHSKRREYAESDGAELGVGADSDSLVPLHKTTRARSPRIMMEQPQLADLLVQPRNTTIPYLLPAPMPAPPSNPPGVMVDSGIPGMKWALVQDNSAASDPWEQMPGPVPQADSPRDYLLERSPSPRVAAVSPRSARRVHSPRALRVSELPTAPQVTPPWMKSLMLSQHSGDGSPTKTRKYDLYM